MKQEELKKKLEAEQKIIDLNTQIKNKISYGRLTSFLAFVVFLSLCFFNKLWAIPVAVILFVGFIILSVIHHKYFKIVEDATYRTNVIKDYLNRFTDQWKKSGETGNEFNDKKYFEADLDVFGKNSLYSYLCFAKTAYGRQYLADSLKANVRSKDEICKDNEVIKNLDSKFDQTLNITKSSYEYGAKNQDHRISSVENALNLIENKISFSHSKLFISAVLILAFIASIVLTCLKKVPGYSIALVLGVNYFVSMMLYREAGEISQSIAKMNDVFYGYDHLIEEINHATFEASNLVELQENVKKLQSKSIKAYKFLQTIAESRNNIIFSILLNGICNIDGFLLLGFEKWQAKYANDFRNGLMSIGKIEAYISLATIAVVKEKATFGTIANDFEFEEIGHPLIKESSCVGNSFVFKGLNIITGSNMSGKTTFMRSIGTNYILFLAGTCVCASKFEAPILKMYTSMKVTDDVNNNISTFYGEILRVKEICEYVKKNQPMLVLIDEIFKGTNTKDRIVGAINVAAKLKRDNIYAIITTHDPELCATPNASNYHFLEHYVDDKIQFDYKIHNGVSQTRNAIYLLKMAGIIDEND